MLVRPREERMGVDDDTIFVVLRLAVLDRPFESVDLRNREKMNEHEVRLAFD